MPNSIVRHKVRKEIDITLLVCELLTKIPKKRFLEMQNLGILTLHTFAALSTLTSEIDAGNFRSISIRLAILQHNLQNDAKCELGHMITG